VLYLPNIGDANITYDAQAVRDAVDNYALGAGVNGTGVISGCQVTQDTGADLKFDIAAGVVQVAGVQYTVGALTAQALTAASTGDRRDTVVYRAGVGVMVVAGPVCGTSGSVWNRGLTTLPPVKASLCTTGISAGSTPSGFINPSTDCIIAELYVTNSTTASPITSPSTSSGNVTAFNSVVDKTNILGQSVQNATVILTSGSSWTCPASGTYKVTCVAGGGGGANGCATNAATSQCMGGPGGGQGESKTAFMALVAGTSYSYVMGTGGAARTVSTPAGGGTAAQNGNVGTYTEFIGPITVFANGSPAVSANANSTSAASATVIQSGGAYGTASQLPSSDFGILPTAGTGSGMVLYTGTTYVAAAAGGAVGYGAGGGQSGAGSNTSGTLGGLGGSAGGFAVNQGAIANGGSGSVNGGNGASALSTDYGAGGGGGGAAGGATGTGGKGGAGGPGAIFIEGPLP
jgi:hypothetical protein